ncbi:hypothetical protein [Nocardioides sp. InS609-2]|uniref:hypothetical protein n=1 Tax=Nocardioides sp. InS609-2 TaxID=2760705 RepID=UPI0020BEE4E4|nr:hypothetical protein [Nocardioides sp. InS609-2]
MNTPTRSEMHAALAAHSAAEQAWREFIQSMRDGDTFEPGASVILDTDCRAAWQELTEIADRLPDDREREQPR